MIIVLLLFFQSICLYCQRLVLYIHDRWINPKNVRLIKEAAETSAITGKQILSNCSSEENRPKKRALGSTQLGAESCRFCANTPQGYCRHHFHLQERQLQQEQQQQNKRFWSNIVVGGDKSLEQRQLRKLNREVKRNLKNRLSALKPQHIKQQQQQQQQQQPINKHSFLDTNGSSNNNINDYKEVTDDDIGYRSASTASLNLTENSSLSSNHSSFPSDASLRDSAIALTSSKSNSQHSILDSISPINIPMNH